MVIYQHILRIFWYVNIRESKLVKLMAQITWDNIGPMSPYGVTGPQCV